MSRNDPRGIADRKSSPAKYTSEGDFYGRQYKRPAPRASRRSGRK